MTAALAQRIGLGCSSPAHTHGKGRTCDQKAKVAMKIYSVLFVLLSASGCLAENSGECRIATDEVVLNAGQFSGTVALAHTPPLLQVNNGELVWNLPSDAIMLRATLALADFATEGTTLVTSTAEYEFGETYSAGETFEKVETWQIEPDEIRVFEVPLSVDPRPKSFYLQHNSLDAASLYVFHLTVDRVVCN